MSSQERGGPREFGEALKSARMGAGVSVDALCERLKLSRKTIEAFENGEFSKLPSRTFGRLFLRQIVEACGEDPARWVAAFDRAWERWLQGSQVIRVSDELPRARRRLGPWIVGLVLVATAVAAVLYLAGRVQGHGEGQVPPTPSALLPLLAPTPSPTPEPEPMPAVSPQTLAVRTGSSPCWVQVRIAGEPMQSRLLPAGATWEVAAGGKQVELVLGDAGAIAAIEYLGETRTAVGRPGEVVRLVLAGAAIPPAPGS